MKEVSELWLKLRPFAMRDIEQLANLRKSVISESRYKSIVLVRNYANEMSRYFEYEASEEGLKAAIANAQNYDVIVLPESEIVIYEPPVNITKPLAIIGHGNWANENDMWDGSKIRNDFVTSSDGSSLISITNTVRLVNIGIFYDAKSSTQPRSAISASMSGGVYIYNCYVYCSNGYSARAVSIAKTSPPYPVGAVTIMNSFLYGDATNHYGIGLAVSTYKGLIWLTKMKGKSYNSLGIGAYIDAPPSTIEFHHCIFEGTTNGIRTVSYTGGG